MTIQPDLFRGLSPAQPEAVETVNGPLPLLCFGFVFQDVLCWNPAVEAPSGQHRQLALRHVEPAAVLRCVVDLQPLGHTGWLHRLKGLIQRRKEMGVQVVRFSPEN